MKTITINITDSQAELLEEILRDKQFYEKQQYKEVEKGYILDALHKGVNDKEVNNNTIYRDNITNLDLCMITNGINPNEFQIKGNKCYRKIGSLGWDYIGEGYVEVKTHNKKVVRNIFFKPIMPVEYIEVTFKINSDEQKREE